MFINKLFPTKTLISAQAISKKAAQKLPYHYWEKKNWYYHQHIFKRYQTAIIKNARILHIGSKIGSLLHALHPSYAVGIEFDDECRNKACITYPTYMFAKTIEEISPTTFDYIVISCATHEYEDIQCLFESLKIFCSLQTRIILDHYSWAWEPILRITQKLGLRRNTKLINWITSNDIAQFLQLAGFEVIKQNSSLLLPYYIPLLSSLCNAFLAHLPFIRSVCLLRWMVAKPNITPSTKNYSVSVIIPCKNERGNIKALIERTPIMGTSTELIFVEGHSHDGTYEEIEQQKILHPEKTIQIFKQQEKGKGEAVRLGFAQATGNILMILDADLTVPPEELPKFYAALVNGHGECINGSRLVYGMEHQAMRFLNMLGNYFFARLFSWLLGQPIKDTLCGTKVLFKKDYERIAAQRHFFGNFDPFGDFDILFGAAHLHLKIIDLPIHYKARTYGTTQIRRFYHGLLLLKMSWIGFKRFKLF